MSGASHPLFTQFPLHGESTTSAGIAPTPYLIYDGHGTVILGQCDAAALVRGFSDQDVHRVLTRSGQGILGLFVCDFTDASHDPPQEFHITPMAAVAAGQVLPDDPAAALAAMGTRSELGLLSLHLWNDSPLVVAYNTDYLGLAAKPATDQISLSEDRLDFDFTGPDGIALASGHFHAADHSDSGLMLRVMRHLGLRGFLQSACNKISQAFVINRKSDMIAANGWARTHTAPTQ